MFNQKPGIWRLSLEQIEATVADHLGVIDHLKSSFSELSPGWRTPATSSIIRGGLAVS
jgi:hypothetical protein